MSRLPADLVAPARNESPDDARIDRDETHLAGYLYVDPPEKVGAETSWWVVDELVGSSLDDELASFVPGWTAANRPSGRPRRVGIDPTSDDWLALPGAP